MAILVTGGSGVLGLHVAACLARAGETVVAYSTSGIPAHAGLVLGDDAASRVTFVQGDVRDFDRLRRIAEEHGVEGIIHAAALTGEAQACARSHEVFAVNVAGTVNVLELARTRKLRRIVYIGSASEYGRRADMRPIGEQEANPAGLYAETKHLGHRLGQRYRAIFGIDVITVRVSSVFGPNTRFNPYRKLVGNTLIAHLCRAAALGESVTLEGGADYPRDWTYAEDTAQGVCLAYHAKAPHHAVYNVASGRSYTVAEVVETLRRVEPSARFEVGPGRWDDNPYQAANLRGPLDISRAGADLNYAPRHSLEAGLRKYIAWWRRIGASASPDEGHAPVKAKHDAMPPPENCSLGSVEP